MKFSLTNEELDFIDQLDELIKTTDSFEEKQRYIGVKLDFFKEVFNLEKKYLDAELEHTKLDNGYRLERLKIKE